MKYRPFFISAAVLLLAGCGGAQTAQQTIVPSAQVPAAATPLGAAAATPMPEIVLGWGNTDGLDNQFSPNDGDTSSGGNGGTIDGIPCAATMYDNYHVHAFVGIMVAGKEMATPDAIGLYEPGPETNGVTDTAHCYYAIHTHDASGMIHLESSSTAPLGSSIFTLGNLLDVWGMPISPSHFGPYSGTVRVFYATTPLTDIYSGTYHLYTGTAPKNIQLYSHEAIWIQIGANYVPASRLPKIRFYTEY
jgi:hypothetical protein